MEDESVFGLDNDLQETISFYYIVQIVDNTVQDTALSVDDNEVWLGVKDKFSKKAIDDYMDKIKGVFNSYLENKELIV